MRLQLPTKFFLTLSKNSIIGDKGYIFGKLEKFLARFCIALSNPKQNHENQPHPL